MKKFIKGLCVVTLLTTIAGVTTFTTMRFDDVKKVVTGPVYSQTEVDKKVEEEGQNKYEEGKQDGFEEGVNYVPGLSVDLTSIGINGPIKYTNLSNGDIILGCPRNNFHGVFLIEKKTEAVTKIINYGNYWHFKNLDNGNVLITGNSTYIYNSQSKSATQRYYETSFSNTPIKADNIFEIENGKYVLVKDSGTEMYLYDEIEDNFILLGNYASSFKPIVLNDGSLLMVCSQSNKQALYKIDLTEKTFTKKFDNGYFSNFYEINGGCLIGGRSGSTGSGLLYYNYSTDTVTQLATNSCGFDKFYTLEDGSVLCGSTEFGIFNNGEYTKICETLSNGDLSYETENFLFFSSSSSSYGIYVFDKKEKTMTKVVNTGDKFSFVEIGDYIFFFSNYEYLTKINYFDLKTKEIKSYGDKNYYNFLKTNKGLLISTRKGSFSNSVGCVYFEQSTSTFKEIINFGIDYKFKIDSENNILIENTEYIFSFDEVSKSCILKHYKMS